MCSSDLKVLRKRELALKRQAEAKRLEAEQAALEAQRKKLLEEDLDVSDDDLDVQGASLEDPAVVFANMTFSSEVPSLSGFTLEGHEDQPLQSSPKREDPPRSHRGEHNPSTPYEEVGGILVQKTPISLLQRTEVDPKAQIIKKVLHSPLVQRNLPSA